MSNKSRQISYPHKRRLDILSGNRCAAPDCQKSILARDGLTIVGKICHIEAASSGGARYNGSMSDEDRRHFNNLILLCSECHEIIDNPENEGKYPVSLLKKWKADHESKQQEHYARQCSQALILAINKIADITLEEREIDERFHPFDIDKKIEFNSLKRNRPLIEEYAPYFTKINGLYKEMEKEGSFKKEKLLRVIRQVYLDVLKEFTGSGKDRRTVVQNNGDAIFESVQEAVYQKVGVGHSVEIDDFDIAAPIIMVDAFMRCKILENPKI